LSSIEEPENPCKTGAFGKSLDKTSRGLVGLFDSGSSKTKTKGCKMALKMKSVEKKATKKSATKSTGSAKKSTAKGKATTAKKSSTKKAAAPELDLNSTEVKSVLKKLKTSKKGKTASELGVTSLLMGKLEAAGKVKRNGTKALGGRGRPPIMWVLK
jgi:hypothetical protein